MPRTITRKLKEEAMQKAGNCVRCFRRRDGDSIRLCRRCAQYIYRYKQKVEYKEQQKGYFKSWRKKHPEKGMEHYWKFRDRAIARDLARAALRKGIISKRPCQVCGSEKSEMHHEDYSKPYDVIWLCKKHHGRKRHIQ